MRAQLIIDGIVNRTSGHFRPYFLANVPTKMLENIMPTAVNDEIHEASLTVIRPDDNGDWFEENKKIAGLHQPIVMPSRNPINETISGERDGERNINQK